ncbi:orc1/cdc6 family replication initiation protein [Haloprofundus marisrubri]|uniref:ORC1-type DNA replication protein n=1 Tax=Haloprofundus marisrubri TaxID=1514971 RepID=A0A0W1RCC7_9EURY|nr:AAA family ATPase [Haloprofundus marisrubri]KTG11035.1 orc1/cdc6 family replication initiation protein [Haloprofundus marisrubri]
MVSQTEQPSTLGEYAAEHGAVAHSRSTARDDPLSVLDEEDPIFANEDLLRIDHIPDHDKIVGRNSQIETVARRLKPTITGGSGKGTLLLGKSGSGKTLVTRYVSREVEDRAANNDVRIGRAVIDCAQRRSEVQTVIHLARSLNDPTETGIKIPHSGIATGAYYDRLWSVIDALYDAVIVVLDEIDRLAPSDDGKNIPPEEADDSKLLMQLSRAGEENDVEASITVVGISNDLKYGDRLDTRVESSFAPDEIVFPAYDANQLGDILDRRRDAYRDGVLSDAVIPLCSAFSAQEHGDARRGLDLFRLAGEVARDDDADQVREEHVHAANDDAEVTRIQDLIRGCPTQAKVAIAALAALDEFTEHSHFKATQMYRVYRDFAEAIGMTVLGQKRITDQLREYETLKIIDMTRTSDGYREGTYLQLSLLDEASLLLQSVGLDEQCAQIPIDSHMRRQFRSIAQQ